MKFAVEAETGKFWSKVGKNVLQIQLPVTIRILTILSLHPVPSTTTKKKRMKYDLFANDNKLVDFTEYFIDRFYDSSVSPTKTLKYECIFQLFFCVDFRIDQVDYEVVGFLAELLVARSEFCQVQLE